MATENHHTWRFIAGKHIELNGKISSKPRLMTPEGRFDKFHEGVNGLVSAGIGRCWKRLFFSMTSFVFFSVYCLVYKCVYKYTYDIFP